jgi:hypothetical protein
MVTCSGFAGDTSSPTEDTEDPRYLDALVAQADLNNFLEVNYEDFRGVIGHGIGRSDVDGDYALEVYARKILPRHLENLPVEWEGFEVRIIEVGRVTAF